jgi:hypothetical protein
MPGEEPEYVNEPRPGDERTKRFFVKPPPNYCDLSEEEQMAACREMAREARRQMGLEDDGK